MHPIASRIHQWVAERTSPRPEAARPPLRDELLNGEALKRCARILAEGHAIQSSKGGANNLLATLDSNERVLLDFNRSTPDVEQARRITPAAEWLLDNFYLIEDQIRMARLHLPQGYSRELPRLARGPSAGLPRVYDLVLELIAHTDAQIDADALSSFVAAYQTNAPLMLGELWAVPIMLRLGLIENLARVTQRLAIAREERNLADSWVDRLQTTVEANPSALVLTVADMARAEVPLTSPFVAEFCQRLTRQRGVLQLARSWLEQRLADQGLSTEQLVHHESRNQAADQVSVSHSISSLRFLSAMDWKDFVEALSHVEVLLRGDPAAVYGKMDFATRDRYRHVVESLARHSRQPESSVAQNAILLAEAAARTRGRTNRSAHVGYFLIDKGLPALEKTLEVRWPGSTLVARCIRRFPLAFFAGGIALLTLLLTAGFFLAARRLGVACGPLTGFTLVFLLCASQLAVAVMNWLSSVFAKPSLLPRLDYSAGIAPESRTMVVVPTLLSSKEGVLRLVELLEIHYLANRDPHLSFALLTDFRDASQAVMPGDEALLRQIRAGVSELAHRYRTDRSDIFFLLHRRRRWNAGEGLWMGYERKRGKLAEFNALLRGGPRENFSVIDGDASILPAVRYVITLDTDTQLPRDAARRLAGTIAHPLNQPEFDPVRGIVTEGYGILQPRMGVSLPSAGRSWFARVFAGDAGIDPYTRAVSDVYQDVFQEGSFIGKGIYAVDAFRRAMAGRFPENAILSHDLLEACHARSALVSDIELYEEYPSRYNVDTDRRHRWIRGDWQIGQWLLPRVPGPDARRIANPLSGLSRWKLFDNLRRSLVPVALLLLLLGDWLLLPELRGALTLVVLTIVLLPALFDTLCDAVGKPRESPWAMHARAVLLGLGRQFCQACLALAFLPYDAFNSLDAVCRTLLRLLVTHRRLLEWQSSSEVERTSRSDLLGFVCNMWIAPALALATAGLLAARPPALPGLSLPLLCVWFVSPWIAWWISQPIARPPSKLTARQTSHLHRIARKTWHFFDTFVVAQENWLPPDNFQEYPVPVVASRTSPTNMGLALLANLAAWDFGYVSAGRLLRRTQDALATMQRLERHRGHFLNWYDTRTLQPLPPRYVSSVDSGNLAGHLLTLSAGLRELCETPVFAPLCLEGLRDTLGLLLERSGGDPELARLDAELARTPEGLRAAHAVVERVASEARRTAAAPPASAGADFPAWSRKLAQECEDHLADWLLLAPWLANPPSGRLPDASESLAARLTSGGASVTLRDLARLEQAPESSEGEVSSHLRASASRARERILALEAAAHTAEEFAAMDFTALFDVGRNLFAIGFNVADRRRDISFYDLLASEARLCSYVAIALGQIPQEHWFSLGRLLVRSGGGPILVSWSGSMFEYLMPQLVMPCYEHTLLARTCTGAVAQQIAYGRARRVPWGISESGYNRTDANLNYQYRAFGVPGLGLKRCLAEDLVIAPYATLMALLFAPREAVRNMEHLAAEGLEGIYGFYEAVDYTPSRLPPGRASATIRSYMAHHQGMGFLGLVWLLRNQPMQRRFLASPLLKAADLLLQERLPRTGAISHVADSGPAKTDLLSIDRGGSMRVFADPSTQTPEIHLLSNGRYHVAVSNAGGGYSRWRDLAVTRWREDATRDCWGFFIYLRNVASGETWSAAHQPVLRSTKRYEAIFTQARAEFRQRLPGLEVHTEICVSPEDDVELRRVRLENTSAEPRAIELTSYAEVVLAPAAADAAHPAFSNLFVQTEFLPEAASILCTRRARSTSERPPWLLHLLGTSGGVPGEVSCETDRARFIGRGRTLAQPEALRSSSPLSNTAGSVLDPIVALRRTVTVQAGETVAFDLALGVAETREAALLLAAKYRNPRMVDRAFDLAWTHSQVTLRQLDATESEAQVYGGLAGALVFADASRRAGSDMLLANRRGQSGLWSYGISGDVPLVLLQVGHTENLDSVRQLIRAHAYWRLKGLTVELLILCRETSHYRQSLQELITGLIASGDAASMLGKPGGIFVRQLEQVPGDDRVLLQSVARLVFDDQEGAWIEQTARHCVAEAPLPKLIPLRTYDEEPLVPIPLRDLTFFNGTGGFTRDGHEYVIVLQPDRNTPAPWVNVISNPHFGTVVSESGGAYTWAENAHEFRLTPWHNDSVQDASGEALYLRDEETGRVWSPMPQPARGATPYVVRHGFGYSVFEHTEHGIAAEVWIYVAMDAPVKFTTVRLRNVSGRPRRLSVTGYWEWVLGDLRSRSLMHIQTEVDLQSGALFARNPYNTEFPDRVVFIDVDEAARTLTGDRREFLGRNGSPALPAALRRNRLSGRVGAGLDPCGALQVAVDLPEGQEHEIRFRLGVARNTGEVQDLIRRFRGAEASHASLRGVWAHWNSTLGAVNVDTPDPAVNIMANGWLLYQTLGCRLWGRTGFYQSGGAFGFRDQLQDAMALVHAEPALLREHLLRAASRQFGEGDVQHWWHPPSGRGVRTHFSDDYLWLPYATCHYVAAVADMGVLDERIRFLEGRAVLPDEEACYDLPTATGEAATLYTHCVRAIERGLRFGAHGLPLIGGGDWNDGLNLVGPAGRGESVWLAFFLHDVLTRFAVLARAHGDSAFAERCLEQASQLQRAIELHAWDGLWYRRAYFDDGTPLGSSTNPECQIDSLPQSWAVLSGAGEPARARQALRSVEQHLVRRDAGLIQLFDPPFDRAHLDPGYIKGYIPGVRENGGQYTHAAIWFAMALAALDENERAWDCFNLLNPIRHGSTAAESATYRVEPYVVAADVYALAPHTGRGGWTWYTGSAGWMYRLLLDTLLGLNLQGDRLLVSPRFPKAWTSYKIHYRYRQTVYHITCTKLSADSSGLPGASLDGQTLPGPTLALLDDRREHFAEVRVLS